MQEELRLDVANIQCTFAGWVVVVTHYPLFILPGASRPTWSGQRLATAACAILTTMAPFGAVSPNPPHTPVTISLWNQSYM